MRKDWSIKLLAAGLAAALVGCGDEKETGYLMLSQVSGIAIEDDGCGAPDKKLVPPLSYDAGIGALGADYLLGLWIRNDLVANDDTETSVGRINTNRVQVQQIEVEFIDRERWGFLPEVMSVGMPFVVDSEAEVGWPTGLIPAEAARLMIEHPESPIAQRGSYYASLPVRIRVVGKLLDGTAVKSNDFQLNLRVCNECLSFCPEGSEPKVCSIAQPDLFECEKASASDT